jgi:hypothetical protein
VGLWAWFAGGLLAGGALVGGLLGLLAVLLPLTPTRGAVALAALAAVVLAAHDLRVAAVALPQRRSLIPQEVFLRSPAVGFVRFGLEFGSGLRTYVTSAAPYAVVALVLLTTEGALAGLLAGASFGLGRSVAPLQAVAADEAHWSADLAAVSRTLERAGSLAVAGVAVGLLVLAVP